MSETLMAEPLKQVIDQLPDTTPFAGLKFGSSVSPGLSGVTSLDGAIDFMLAKALQSAKGLPDISQIGDNLGKAEEFFEGALDVMSNLRALVKLAQSGSEFVSETLISAESEPCVSRVSLVLGEVRNFISEFVKKCPPSQIVASINGTNERILEKLRHEGTGVSMSVLYDYAGVSSAAITGAVDRLEKYPVNSKDSRNHETVALVQRIHASDDRRKINVEPTAIGRLVTSQIAAYKEINDILLLLGKEKPAA